MRRNRLLLPWGLLAGLLIAVAIVEGLNIKPPSLLKKQRNYTTTTPWPTPTPPSRTTTTSTTTTTTETPETTVEAEHENATLEGNATTKSPLSGIPQIDYVLDPNLPRELPRGYNLSEYPFFDRVPNDIDFECDGLLDGFYASIFYKCQIYHHCVSGIRYDFLCANYTAFDQRTFICQFVSEVDCANSAKWFFRNEPLYKGRITTTSSTTTVATTTTAATRRPPAGAGAGRRRRPAFRRRRPQYDYYYDDDYEEDEYEDDQSLPPAGNRQRKRQRRPSSGSIAAADADVEDKPIRAPAGGGGGSVYDRPRVLPKIRRPVPKNERDKYDYVPKDGSTDNGGGEKQAQEITERSTAPAEKGKELERPKRPVDPPAPAPEAEKPRGRPQKPRPQEDDEYYDDDDYDQPIRTSARKNNQDYYAPSGGDRDFNRRPVMTGAGRPLRRNRPGRRKPAPIEYDDDDYEEDRRPFRPSAPALDDRRRPEEDRRRPSAASRKRPSHQREDYDRDSTYDRPQSYRETKRPQSSRDTYDDRPSTSNRDSPYERTATPTREVANERPAPSKREPTRERQATPARGERPTTSNRDTAYERHAANERPAASSRDTAYERQAANERPATSSRDTVYERASPSNTEDRAPIKDTTYERLSGNKKRTQSTTRETTYERTRPERPGSRNNPDYDRSVAPDTQTSTRPLTSRNRYSEVESDEPIPAPRPAYISTTGRSSFRKRGPEEVRGRLQQLDQEK